MRAVVFALLLVASCINNPAPQGEAASQQAAAPEPSPAIQILPGTDKGRPNLSDMLSMPKMLGALKLEQLYRSFETSAPAWPVIATYGTDWMTPNLARLECEPSTAKKLHCPREWKMFPFTGGAGCKQHVPEGYVMVRWLRDGMDCILSVAPETQSNLCRISNMCDGDMKSAIAAADESASFMMSGRPNSPSDEEIATAIRRGKHPK